LVREGKGKREAIYIALTAAGAETFFPTPEIAPYDRQQDKETDYYLAKTETGELMDGTSLPDEAQKRILSFLLHDVNKRNGDPSRSSLLMSVKPREPPKAIVWTEPMRYALEAGTRQLHGAELPSFAEIAKMGSVEKVGLMGLCSYLQTYAHATKAATQIRLASKTQRSFADFKTLLSQVMKRKKTHNGPRGYGRKEGETMEQYWLRIGELYSDIQDPTLRKLGDRIEKIMSCSNVDVAQEGPLWARHHRDWFVDNKCPYAPPRETPEADELAWIGRCYKDKDGVWCIKKVEFSQQDRELAVYAYPADEEPPEDDDELERELLDPFKEALDEEVNVWVESDSE